MALTSLTWDLHPHPYPWSHFKLSPVPLAFPSGTVWGACFSPCLWLCLLDRPWTYAGCSLSLGRTPCMPVVLCLSLGWALHLLCLPLCCAPWGTLALAHGWLCLGLPVDPVISAWLCLGLPVDPVISAWLCLVCSPPLGLCLLARHCPSGVPLAHQPLGSSWPLVLPATSPLPRPGWWGHAHQLSSQLALQGNPNPSLQDSLCTYPPPRRMDLLLALPSAPPV